MQRHSVPRCIIWHMLLKTLTHSAAQCYSGPLYSQSLNCSGFILAHITDRCPRLDGEKTVCLTTVWNEGGWWWWWRRGGGEGGYQRSLCSLTLNEKSNSLLISRFCNPVFIKQTIWKGNMPKKEKTSALWSEFRTSPFLYCVWVLSKKTNITYQCGDIFLRYLKMFDFPQHYWIWVTNRLHIGHHEGDTPWICHYPLGWDQANTLQINGTKISRTELQS